MSHASLGKLVIIAGTLALSATVASAGSVGSGFGAALRGVPGEMAIEKVHGGHRSCQWGPGRRWWHYHLPNGRARACRPGAGWVYRGVCWWGPGGLKYCVR